MNDMTMVYIILAVFAVTFFLVAIGQFGRINRLRREFECFRKCTNDRHGTQRERANDLLKLVKELAETQGYTVRIDTEVEINPFAKLFRKPVVTHRQHLRLEKYKKLKVAGSASPSRKKKRAR